MAELSQDDPDWEIVPLPFPADVKRPWINVIRGTGRDDIWLLCTVRSRQGERRLAFHYDGDRWAAVEEMPARGNIYPVGPRDVWAAGAGGSLAHFDGERWTSHRFAGFYYDFVDVFARPGADVWMAAAGPRVVHFDGVTFTELAPPELVGSTTHELWGTSRDILVPMNAKNRPTSVARYGGERWSLDELGQGGATLIHGSGPDDIWVLSRRHGGWHFDGSSLAPSNLELERTSQPPSSSWTYYPTHPGPLWALTVTSPTEAYAVGEGGIVLRWDGERWQASVIATKDQLVSVYRPPGGPLLVGGRHLYRSKQDAAN